jgi:serine/threonine protein kinase
MNLERYIQQHSPTSNRPMIVVNVWDIINQITAGVAYIHSHKQVHRDLNPRNGLRTTGVALTCISALRWLKGVMEDRGLRVNKRRHLT